jgi:hypothetical protein
MFSQQMNIVLTTRKSNSLSALFPTFPEAALTAAQFGSALVTTKRKRPELLMDTATALD